MRRAFTLIELLVVISIIAVLAAMLIPVVSSVRNSADTLSCSHNIGQVASATIMYSNDFRGNLPPVLNMINWGGGSATTNYWYNSIYKTQFERQYMQVGSTPLGYAINCPLVGCPTYKNDEAGLAAKAIIIDGFVNGSALSYAYNQFPFKTTRLDNVSASSAGINYAYGKKPTLMQYTWKPVTLVSTFRNIRYDDVPNKSTRIMFYDSNGTATQPLSPNSNPAVDASPYNDSGTTKAWIQNSYNIDTYLSARHNGKLNAAFWDGHVQTISQRQAVLCLVQPQEWNGQSEPSDSDLLPANLK